MKKDYSKHFLMKINDVKEYAIEQVHYFEPEAKLTCSEIGDGNINYVFKITDENTRRSLVIKQADKFLRSSGRPLDLHRNKIEAEILKIEGSLAPSMVPKIYYYDEPMCALSMEDISAYKNLRTEMLNGKMFIKLADNISSFLVDTLLPTTDLVVDRAEKKRRVQLFTNIALCDITEDLVLTEPYYNYKNRNVITKGNESFVKEHLYTNETLKAEVGELRDGFMNRSQALIHGDLHSGSIFINESGLKVIDPEFAFYGPMGYDIGNVIGNMFFTLTNKLFTAPQNIQFIDWAQTMIKEIVDKTKLKFDIKFDQLVSFPLYNEKFKQQYIASIMADSLGYAGTEIIRRTVGDTKVKEITIVTDSNIRIPMERTLIMFGSSLIMNRKEYDKGEQLITCFAECRKDNC
jgi:5-methylthioribose kinase